MRHFSVGRVITLAVLLALVGFAAAQTVPGPTSDKPFDEKWAPSKWGATDRAGSANHTNNSAMIARALATVKQNKAITIGKYYHREAPAFGPRGWQMSIPGTPTGGPFAEAPTGRSCPGGSPDGTTGNAPPAPGRYRCLLISRRCAE